MPAVGLEPTTYGLQNRCTTAVLSRLRPTIYPTALEIVPPKDIRVPGFVTRPDRGPPVPRSEPRRRSSRDQDRSNKPCRRGGARRCRARIPDVALPVRAAPRAAVR